MENDHIMIFDPDGFDFSGCCTGQIEIPCTNGPPIFVTGDWLIVDLSTDGYLVPVPR